MSKFFDKLKNISVKKLIHIAEGYDVSPGHLTPEGIGDRLAKFIIRYDDPRGGKVKSVEGINLTNAKIDAGKDYLLIDFRDIYILMLQIILKQKTSLIFILISLNIIIRCL